MAGNPTARTHLWLQTFMCLLTDTDQGVCYVAALTQQLQSTDKYLKSVLIHECPLPFLTLLLLFYGQGERRTEMQQPLLSSQCCNLEYTDFHTMSHHCDFWLQHWSSGSQAPSFAHQEDIICTKYTMVRLSKATDWVSPLGSEALFVMQNPSKIRLFTIIKMNGIPSIFFFFLQPPLTHSAFNCHLNNAEEEIEQDQGVCCTLNWKDVTCFPRQNTAIRTWAMQNLSQFWWKYTDCNRTLAGVGAGLRFP